jgi:hypothetical protein
MKTVMDAVNEFRGEWRIDCQGDDEQLALYQTEYSPEFPDSKKGELHKGFTGFLDDIYLQVCTRSEFLATVAECKTNFGRCTQSYEEYKRLYNSVMGKDTQAPVYTQEMDDNGELPSVGAYFLHEGKKVKCISTSEEEGGVVTFLTNSNAIDCCWNNGVWVKPLTPPVELIDGKAYQFDCGANIRIGIFSGNGFSGGIKSYWTLSACTNIQPLTVETK